MSEAASVVTGKLQVDKSTVVSVIVAVLVIVLLIWAYNKWMKPKNTAITAAAYALLSDTDKAKYQLAADGSGNYVLKTS